MPLFKKRSQKDKPEAASTPDHAVLIRFKYGRPDLGPISELEDRLIERINAAGVGEYDGNEVATDGSDGILYMYGPDADALFAVVRPTLEAVDFMAGARATLRYGAPGPEVKQKEVTIGA